MIRSFDNGRGRQEKELSFGWYLCPDPNGVGTEERWYEKAPSGLRIATVPGCWNFELDLFTYDGNVWYFTEFEADEENACLFFSAVNNECDVYVDGKAVFHHYGPFSPFRVLLPRLGRGKHTLTLRVDAHHNMSDTIPKLDTDWFNYGGIIRPVSLVTFEDALILSCYLDYSLSVPTRTAEASATLELFAAKDVTLPLTVSVAGVSAETSLSLKACECTIATLSLPTLRELSLWDIGKGNLYDLTTTLGSSLLRDRVGFRTIETKGPDILLNGRKIFFQAANRHEEHPAEGFSVSPTLIKRDLDIAVSMGCNGLRGSHYPQSSLTLDLLDEMGLLFWEEIPLWGFKAEQMELPLVKERAHLMLSEMILRDRNRPSVIFFSIGNEDDSSSEPCRALFETLYARAKELSHGTLTVFASNRYNKDICYDYTDVVAINIYPVWYGSYFTGWALPKASPSKDWPIAIEGTVKYMESVGHGDKPLIISEFGLAAMAGNNDAFMDNLWTEPKQEEVYREAMPILLSHPRLSGTIVWQFCDSRTCLDKRNMLSRPNGYNNKGILDAYRRPKRGFYAVRDAYLENYEHAAGRK